MHQTLAQLIQAANNIILGKEQQIRLSLCCLLTGGHLLIEDIPGVGKTTLAHTLAKLMGLEYQRIQFTVIFYPRISLAPRYTTLSSINLLFI